MLPKDFPDKINCIDTAGLQQGWWIKYKVEYNPVYIPDDLPKGYYVGNFSYGKYQNGKKIGDWKTINNRHLIYEEDNKNYYYAEDTIVITNSWGIPFYNEFEILTFNTAMTVFIKTETGKPTIIIERNKNKVGSELFTLKTGDEIKYLPIRFLETAIAHPDIKLIDGVLAFDAE